MFRNIARAVLLAGLLGAADVRAQERPNILFLFIDDWGRYASVYADPQRPGPNDVVRTPHMDQLAEDGVLFANAFVGVPSCTPSRASVATGSYFWRTGRTANLQGGEWDNQPDPGDGLPGAGALLQQQGYYLGRLYKTFDARWTPGKQLAAGQTPASTYSQTVSADPNEGRRRIEDEIRGHFRAFLEARPAGAPFFFSFGPHNPHRPWVRGSGAALWSIDPDRLSGRLPAFLPDVPAVREDFADYLGEVQAVDAYLGYLLDEIGRAGVLHNTLIVLTGDNGIPGFPRGKTTLYDLGAAAPLIVRWDKGINRPGRVITDFVNLMDLAPTFLEAAGIRPPEKMDGESLMAQLTSERSGRIDSSRTFVVTGRERHVAGARPGGLPYPSRAVRTDGYLYIRNFKPDRWPVGAPNEAGSASFERLAENTYAAFPDIDASPAKAWIVTHRDDPAVKPLYELGFGKRPAEELYDLRADPDQVRNVAAEPEYAAVKAELSRRLAEVMQQTGDPRLEDAFDRPPYTESDAAGRQPRRKKRSDDTP